MYDYLFLDLDSRTEDSPRAELVRHLETRVGAELASAGGEVLGVFGPQLGWRASQAAVLIGWAEDSPGRQAAVAALTEGANVRSATLDRLAPTARPLAIGRPEPGGVYVHRWFVIDAGSIDAFVTLSTEAWRDFEARFAASIYGLFVARASDEDEREGVRRMLLLTRYRDHGVWEESRDPTTTAMDLFRRRGALTRDSWGASTLLLPGSATGAH